MKVLKSRKITHSEIYEDQEFEKHLSSEETYDDLGNLVEIRKYDMEGNGIALIERVYEGKNLVSEKNHNLQQDYTEYRTYKYTNDIITEEIEHFENGTFFKTSSHFDEHDRVALIITSDENDAMISKREFEYESMNKTESKYDEEEMLVEKKTTHFDQDQNETRVEFIQYFPHEPREVDQVVTTIYELEYVQNNAVSEKVERDDKIISSKKMEYDSLGNVISILAEDHNLSRPRNIKINYNGIQKVELETEHQGEKLIFSQSYKYDAQAQITERLSTFLNEADLYITRKQVIENEYY